MQKGIRYGTFLFTCTGASIGQVGRDCEFSALIHTHALQTFVNASDQSALPEQAHLCVSFLVAETKQKFDEDTKETSEVCLRIRGCKLWRKDDIFRTCVQIFINLLLQTYFCHVNLCFFSRKKVFTKLCIRCCGLWRGVTNVATKQRKLN